jgi:transcriptional regulator with XRE-family HTH domain
MKFIGSRIKELRNFLKMTQEELAVVLGVDRSHISKVENEIDRPSKQLIILICEIFCINKEWLMGNDNVDIRSNVEEYLQTKMDILGKEQFFISIEKIKESIELTNFDCGSFTLDTEITNIIKYIKEIGISDDKDRQAWLKIQFKEAFPKFEEWREKQLKSKAKNEEPEK